MIDTSLSPLLDRSSLEQQFDNYQPTPSPEDIPSVPFVGLESPSPAIEASEETPPSALEKLESDIFSSRKTDPKIMGGGIPRSLAEVSSDRYKEFVPGAYNNEDAYGQGQGWPSKMVSGVGKGLVLTGTTFLQSTVGMVNGVAQAISDGKFSSFYDNEMNRNLDELNKKMEDILPNYYTNAERDAHWYSPSKLLSGNFIWDGIVKNLGFSAGAALAGMTFAGGIGAMSKALSSIPKLGKLISVGKAAEAVAATEEGLLATEKAAETYGKVKSLSDQFLGNYNVLNPGQRILVAGLATTGEAGFEAYQNLNQFRNERIQEYKDNHHGEAPIGTDLEAIDREADHVGNSSFVLNTALLSATNYIQFPKILGSSYKVEKGIVNSLTKETGEIIEEAGKYVEKTGSKGMLSILNKIRPYTFSASEGFEEGAQFAIQTGTQDYYNKKYKHNDTNFFESLAEGVSKTLSTDEGMENILIGGLSGALMLGKGKFREAREQSKNTADAVSQFNKFRISDFTRDTMGSIVRGTALQEEREALLKAGNISASKDKEADYILNYLAPRIKYGRYDLVRSDIETAKALASTDEGFAQLQAEGKALMADTKEAYLERLSGFEKTAETVKSLYQSLHLRYGSYVDEKGAPIYTPAVMEKLVYAASKIADYDKRLATLSAELVVKGINVDQIAKDIVNGDDKSYEAAIAMIDSMNILQEDKVSLKISLEDVAKMSLYRTKFLEEYSEMKTSPRKYQDVRESTTKVDENGNPVNDTIVVKTKKGEKEVNLNEEYYLGNAFDKEGKPIYPKLKIISQSEDGKTITIEDKNGRRDISAAELESYHLGKVSDIDKSENSRFFYRNIVTQPNTKVFWNRGAKKGGAIEGRLRYDVANDKLFFVYTQNGKQKSLAVGIDSFTAKEGFENGIFYFDHPLTVEDKTDIDTRKKSGKTAEDQKSRRADRIDILNTLYNDISEEQTRINKLIDAKRTEVESLNEKLEKTIEELNQPTVVDKRTKGRVKFTKYGNQLLQTARRLSKAKDQLEKEIVNLTDRNSDIDNTAAYLMNMIDEIDELPATVEELTNELKDHIETLNLLGKETQNQIDAIHKVITSISKAIDAAVEVIHDFIQKFQDKFAHGEFVSMDQTYLDVVSNPNFFKASPERRADITTQFNEDLFALNSLIAETEDFEITPNEQKLADLKEQLVALEKDITDITKEEAAMTAIYERFKKVAEEYQTKEAEEEKLQHNKKLIKEAIGTKDTKNTETTNSDKWYEAVRKKAIEFIWRSTMGVRRGKPHQERANTFGFNLEKFEDKENVFGMYITSNNQDLMGLSGLMTHLVTDVTGNVDESIDQDDIIAMVMVNSDRELLGVDGKPLTEEQLKDPLNHAIYQVMPSKELKWSEEYGGGSMFREGTDEEVKAAIIEQYGKMREDIKEASKGTDNYVHPIKASFGIPMYAQKIDEFGNPMWKNADKTDPVLDYEVRTAIEDAGLIRDDKTDDVLDAFFGDILITIPKTTNIAEGGTTEYTDAMGRPFLKLPNAVLPLQNRRHTAEESETIFQALVQLAKNMMDPEIGIKSEASERLYNWLKSVVYWGVPETREGVEKPAGYNSIFWKVNDQNEFVLTLSGKGKTFIYTPLELVKNKEEIVNMIQLMFMNVNSSKTAKLNEPYEEILSISSDGTINSRTWLNYQSFLLSNKFIPYESSNKNRPVRKDVPLTTVLTPVTETAPINRTGIYFYTSDNEGEMEIPEVKPKNKVKTLTPGKLNENKPVEKKKVVEKTIGKYKMDGTTMYQFTTPKGSIVNFTVKEDGEVMVHPGENVKDVIDAFKKLIIAQNPGVTIPEKQLTDTAKKFIKQMIAKSIAADLVVAEVADTVEEEEDDELQIDDEEEAEDLSEEEKARLTKIQNAIFNRANSSKRVPLRSVGTTDNFIKEDWSKLEKWLSEKFPNLPIYRVKNLITGLNGQQGWGMFHDAAIYIYKNAEVGTAYHEVFHAVWSMFTSPEERKSIRLEFRNRSGSFVDRPTGKTINYADATNNQINEQLAEEFRNYVQDNKIPAKPSKGRPFIVKLFADLIHAIKTFFVGPTAQSNVEELFKNINQGAYKSHIPNANQFAYAKQGVIDIEDAFATAESELSLVSISDKERSEIIQEMTYATLYDIIKNDENLFNVIDKNRTEVYTDLNNHILETVAGKIIAAQEKINSKTLSKNEIAEQKDIIKRTEQLMRNIDKQWPEIISRHEEYMKAYGIEFDENDQIALRDEKGKEDPYGDANKIDAFKKAHSAIKLLLATLPIVDENGDAKESSIGGVVLVPMSQTFISIMNTVHNSRSVEEMLSKLQAMAADDPNYRALYSRIAKREWFEKGVDLTAIKERHGLRLLAAFWATFKKQNPEVKNVYILENGEVVVGDANLSTGAAQLREDYENAIIFKAKEKSKYFIYDEKKKVYVGNADAIKETLKKEDIPSLVKFLSNIGIEFDLKKVQSLQGNNRTKFKNAVLGIKKSISEGKEIVSFSKKALDINGQLLNLGYIQEILTHPEFDSTFFNVTGERTQSFIGTNPASDLYDFLSQIDRFDQANLGDSQYAYLLPGGDSFSQGSTILSRMFTPKGRRSEDPNSQNLMRVVYIGGTDNESRGKQKQSSKLNQKERWVQELNLNIDGYYLNLVPGDASMEWALYMGNAVSLDSLKSGNTVINNIFKGYFFSELNLVREASDRKDSMAKDRNAKEMRFFKAILQNSKGSDQLHNEIIAYEGTVEEVYDHFQIQINNAIKSYITKQNRDLQANLETYGILTTTETGWKFNDINIEESTNDATLERHLTFLNVNFMINNIELHKLLYADPYQYADELKRIKNFNSPRQALINNSPEMNAALDRIWNKGFTRGEIGWTNFTRDYFRSATHKDVMGRIAELADYVTPFKETDGGGLISFPAYRQFRIRIGNWNDAEEQQYVHDMDYEYLRKDLISKGATAEQMAEELAEFNKDNPGVRSAYTPIKPIVSGNKANNKGFNDILLDKFALYPLSYRLMSDVNKAAGKSTSNAIALYDKMQREDIDYIVFENSRKVGAVAPHDTYNSDGSFNNKPYSKKSIINVPFAIISVQSDVPSKDDGSVTRGSQVTKLVTMDYMEAGVPVDFDPGKSFRDRYVDWYNLKTREEKENASPLYKEIKHNQDLLQAMTEQGYQTLMSELGITERIVKGQREYSITDLTPAGETLRNEILKREVNDNISDALQAFIKGKSILEATPAYQQVRNILYSIADREVISPKINGGMKVLIPSALFEDVRIEEVKINGKSAYQSKDLAFYSKNEDGKTINVSEIILGRWFDSDLSDEDLLEYLNNTPEGQKILSGFAFRIPTQKQNSIEVFKIKHFLPREFGDSVVLPAAMVAKTGGDFDIDKLTMYLKNVFTDARDNIKLIPFYGYGEQAKSKFRELYNEIIDTKLEIAETKLEKQSRLQSLFGDIALGIGSDKTIKKWTALFKDWFSDQLVNDKLPVHVIEDIFINRVEKLNKEIDKLTDRDIQDVMEDITVEQWYKKSLQNEYIQSSQNLGANVYNFDRLIQPNSSKQLSDLARKIAEKTIGESFDYRNVGNMLNRVFMTRLRHAFVSGKYAIGIAAVNQTNHSLNQRQPIYIDTTRLKNLSVQDQYWLGDAKIKFEKYNKIIVDNNTVATLSMIKNADGQDISDISSQFIDGYVDIAKGPWIMELGATPNVTSTWLFLVKIGVPIDTIAYFMNQPIIRDYLKAIEKAGYSYLFMDSFVEAAKDEYASKRVSKTTQKSIPSKASLESTVGKTAKDLNSEQKEQQQFILDEFLKYAKMAEHMFYVTQGSNFDTANFNDPYLIFKKLKQLEKAQNTIISNVDDLLENSFVGQLGETIQKMRDALATILKSDQKRVRGIIQDVLTPYTDMSDQDFVRLAQKAVNDLFDYAVQTDQNLNSYISDILLNQGGVAKELLTFMNDIATQPTHPLYDNYIVGHEGILKSIASKTSGNRNPNNIKVKGIGNKAYDQNNIIYAFRELKNHLGKTNSLYNRIVQLAVLQSGLSTSGISFTSVLPHEDFEKIYNKTLSKLETIPNLENFKTLNVFQRNNWNNDDVSPHTKAPLIKSRATERSFYNPAMEFLPKNVKAAIANGIIPQVMNVRKNDRDEKFDHLVYTWEAQMELLTPAIKEQYKGSKLRGYSLLKKVKADMRSRGDYSYIYKGLFEKVRDAFGTPLETQYTSHTEDGDVIVKQYVYKAINAWGDGPRANEFYTNEKASIIDNGFIKVRGVDNSTIIDIFMKDSRSGISNTKMLKNAPEGLPSINRTNTKCGG